MIQKPNGIKDIWSVFKFYILYEVEGNLVILYSRTEKDFNARNRFESLLILHSMIQHKIEQCLNKNGV